jgi:uncharacterized protein YjbJ (UPF0337 family)
MNRDQFAGKWHELKGKIKQKWAKLTDDDITKVNGKFEELSGRLQKKYGWAKEQAEKEINNWCSSCEKGHHSMNDWKNKNAQDLNTESDDEMEGYGRNVYRNEDAGGSEKPMNHGSQNWQNSSKEGSWGKKQDDWRQNEKGHNKQKNQDKDKKRKAG